MLKQVPESHGHVILDHDHSPVNGFKQIDGKELDNLFGNPQIRRAPSLLDCDVMIDFLIIACQVFPICFGQHKIEKPAGQFRNGVMSPGHHIPAY